MTPPSAKSRPRKRAAARLDREAFYRQVLSTALPLEEKIRLMQQFSGLTQDEFAAHRGISVQALRKILSGTGNPTVETLNRIASVFGLEVGFLPKQRDNPPG